ncbi:MAG: UDP-N-acetylmuramoyl-L-alanyl-D-glutamate--2,6-diaminopimelate ligase [Candidatus Peregrinibacteria bacterium]|nr:UDP-N-acetylmuramoyl-L-alanyl-D-glutamate--2,6-diaminopimelate ligase [Candidatus Peregrinibacteria bacterium]
MIRALKGLIAQRNPLRLLWHRAKAFVAALRYGFSARTLMVIGITGTDGKTTTVGMVAHILNETGIKAGALSTAFFQIGNKITWNATQKTSPSPFTIQKFLKRCRDAGCTHVVLEYSSHGLVQHRMDYTWPQVAAITNTTPEHLDYHGTMEQYREDKGILFRMLTGKGTKVLNVEDETIRTYRRIPAERAYAYSGGGQFSQFPRGIAALLDGRILEGDPHHPQTTAMSNDDAFLWMTDLIVTPTSAKAKTHSVLGNSSEETADLVLAIPGQFNLENAACAISCANAIGVPLAESARALATFKGVPGRMERIDAGQPFSVFVDFTVTPASYEKTLSTLKSALSSGNRLLVLTGSCGDRMREKRPTIGKIVSSYADVMVVANEDPYTEEPERIIDEVWAGIDHAKTKAHRIFDRRKAIEFLLQDAKSGDIVILCGKGSDTTMWLKDGQIPWNEREIVLEILRSR